MSRFRLSILLTAAGATIAGMVGGYSLAAANASSLSAWLIAAVGLIVVAFAIVFQARMRADRERLDHGPRTDGREALRQELDRSRRFDRSFTLMRIRMVDPGGQPAGDGHRVDGGTLGMMLRSIDRAWSVNGDTYLLLPECSRKAGRELAVRLSRALPGAFALDSVEYAEFPSDGVTTGALLSNMRTMAENGEESPVRLVRPASTPAERESVRRRSG